MIVNNIGVKLSLRDIFAPNSIIVHYKMKILSILVMFNVNDCETSIFITIVTELAQKY